MNIRYLLWSRVVGAVVAVLVCIFGGTGCSMMRGSGGDPIACEDINTLFEASGFNTPIEINGKATVDANQHQLKGKIALGADGRGDVSFEFTSSILFGAQREDFAFSLVGDTIRIIDRERGLYYEGDDAGRFLRDTFALEFSVAPVLRLALGDRPDCERFEEPRIQSGSGGVRTVSGRLGGESFRVTFAGSGRLSEASWPVGPAAKRERLEIEYTWRGEALHRVEMNLVGREWRCRIMGSN